MPPEKFMRGVYGETMSREDTERRPYQLIDSVQSVESDEQLG